MLRLTIALLALLLCLPALAADDNLLRNGDFAADSDRDGMADSWQFSGDAGVKVTWSRARGKDGPYSQRLTCTSFVASGPASHVMLAQYDTFAFEQDQWYRISFNVKGEIDNGVASVAFQQTEPWEVLGLQTQFRVRPDWRRQSFTFHAPKTISQHLRLQIWFTGTGTMWLDDVSLVKSDGATQPRRYPDALPDLGAKNLIPNGSFECGTSGWGSTGTSLGWIGGLNTLVGAVDHTTAVDHAASFRIDLDKADPPVLAFDWFDATRTPVLFLAVANRGWITVQPGQPYTLSASVKSAPPGVPCAFIVQQAFGDQTRHDFTATADWQRLSFTFTPTTPQVYVGLGPDLTNSGLPKARVWVDAVQLEKGAQMTTYEPRAPLEVGLEWEHTGHFFDSPAQAKAVVTAFNAGPSAQRARVGAAVTDFFDRPASAPGADLVVPPGASVRAELPLGVSQKGFYRFTLTSDAGAVVPTAAERFAVLDPPVAADGLFGMNHAYPTPELLQLSRRFGLTWFRDWSLKWQQVEPQPGQFVFSETDFQIDRVRQQGLNVLGLLPFPSSDWSSTAPAGLNNGDMGEHARQAYKPRDLQEYAAYVRRTVTQYRDRIHVWEILNEPVYTGYALPIASGHTVQDYVNVLRTAYQAIKQVDPQAIVIGGIAAPPQTYVKDLIAADGLRWLDALNLHIYPVMVAPESYLADFDALDAMLNAAGVSKPIYFTEGGYYGDDDLPYEPYSAGDSLLSPLESELEAASYLTRLDLILLAHSTKKIIVHAGLSGQLNQDSIEGLYFEWDGAPRKMVVSQSTMNALFGTDTAYLGTVWEAPHSFAFHSRGRTVVAVWDERNRHFTLTPRPGATLLDLAGAPVTNTVGVGETPYFIVVTGTNPLPALRHNLQNWLTPPRESPG